MNRCLMYSLVLLTLLGGFLLVIPENAEASPTLSNLFQAKPTADVVTTVPVTDRLKAHDRDNATFATFSYASGGTGNFEVNQFTNPALNGIFEPNEFIYSDVDNSRTVTSGDVRRTQVPNAPIPYAVNSTVAAADSDVGNPLVGFLINERHRENKAVDGAFAAGEFIYRDVDLSSAVSIGDVRLTAVAPYAAGSTVVAGDTDIGFALVPFNPDLTAETVYERHRDNISLLGNRGFFANSQTTVNGLAAFAFPGEGKNPSGNIDPPASATLASRNFTSAGAGATWGIRVWKRTSGGVETEITAASPVARITRTTTSAGGVLIGYWTAPLTSLAATDALVIRVYVGSGSAPAAWTLLETFISVQLDASALWISTWSVTYYTAYSTVTLKAEYWFGTTARYSRVDGLVYNKLPTINTVDLKIRYSTTLESGGGTNEQYFIEYLVNPSATVGTLKTSPAGGDTTALATYTFAAIAEPNNAVWNWTDIANLRVRFRTLATGPAGTAGVINEYEVWATINSPDQTILVDPASTTGLAVGSTFNIAVKITNFYDLYGTEFKLGLNTAVLDVATGPRPPTYPFTYWVWNNQTNSNTVGTLIESDVGNATIAFTATERHRENIAANGIFDPGEYMYRDIDNSVTVTAGDLRLTISDGGAAGSTVVGGDVDIGAALTAFAANEKHMENVAVNALYDVAEFMYRDVDTWGYVSGGDVRLTNVDTFTAGTTVSSSGFTWLATQVPVGTAGSSTPSGGGILSIITLKVIGVGASSLNIYDTVLVNSTAGPIPHVTVDGSFSNAGVPEFPLGLAFEIALPVVLIFFWWTRKNKKNMPRSASSTLPARA